MPFSFQGYQGCPVVLYHYISAEKECLRKKDKCSGLAVGAVSGQILVKSTQNTVLFDSVLRCMLTS